MEKRCRARIVILGLVQGVFFRAYARDEARTHHLTGWVRNRSDGAVEALAEGTESDLEDFIRWCHHGPSSARVETVQVSREEPRGEFQTFEVRF